MLNYKRFMNFNDKKIYLYRKKINNITNYKNFIKYLKFNRNWDEIVSVKLITI